MENFYTYIYLDKILVKFGPDVVLKYSHYPDNAIGNVTLSRGHILYSRAQ